MEIRVEMDNEVIILRLAGSLVAASAEQLKGQIGKLIEKRYFFVLLDLGKVDFVDSSGLGACIAANRELATRGGMLAVIGLNAAVARLFQITRADQKIAVHPHRQAGLDALLLKLRTGKQGA